MCTLDYVQIRMYLSITFAWHMYNLKKCMHVFMHVFNFQSQFIYIYIYLFI